MSVGAAEQTTGTVLDSLGAPHVVLHDLVVARTSPPLEHLVIGPGGVFAVEAKRYSNPVVVHGPMASCGGRPMSPVLVKIGRRAAAVRAALGAEVRPVLCVESEVEPDGKRDRLTVEAVEITSLRRLLRVVTRDRKALTFEEVRRLGAVACARFAPAGRRPCACGGELVVRRRRSDGATLLTCSRYPVCRVAEPLGVRRA